MNSFIEHNEIDGFVDDVNRLNVRDEIDLAVAEMRADIAHAEANVIPRDEVVEVPAGDRNYLQIIIEDNDNDNFQPQVDDNDSDNDSEHDEAVAEPVAFLTINEDAHSMMDLVMASDLNVSIIVPR